MSDFRPGAPAAKGLLEKVADEDTEITSSRDGGSGGAGVPGGAPAPKRPFRRYFRETGWRHLIGILVGIFAIFPLLCLLRTARVRASSASRSWRGVRRPCPRAPKPRKLRDTSWFSRACRWRSSLSNRSPCERRRSSALQPGDEARALPCG